MGAHGLALTHCFQDRSQLEPKVTGEARPFPAAGPALRAPAFQGQVMSLCAKRPVIPRSDRSEAKCGQLSAHFDLKTATRPADKPKEWKEFRAFVVVRTVDSPSNRDAAGHQQGPHPFPSTSIGTTAASKASPPPTTSRCAKSRELAT